MVHWHRHVPLVSPSHFVFLFVVSSNFGKLNYYLGKRAADEGRESRYPSIDFCKDPEVICASAEYKELKWVAGSEWESSRET